MNTQLESTLQLPVPRLWFNILVAFKDISNLADAQLQMGHRLMGEYEGTVEIVETKLEVLDDNLTRHHKLLILTTEGMFGRLHEYPIMRVSWEEQDIQNLASRASLLVEVFV